ncbi:hypothetical protein QWZ13_14905 [Reinekea marina]|uniref:hypothetical protein n=1 Tax=Reinekea marina TaxID=1310421 RepID=UPI0025B324EC|nr:hypothetical protein [Reinekea marina]MDN3650206.1 hypothetical protein [Reinekea marina]
MPQSSDQTIELKTQLPNGQPIWLSISPAQLTPISSLKTNSLSWYRHSSAKVRKIKTSPIQWAGFFLRF